jgi:hypothetical protein
MRSYAAAAGDRHDCALGHNDSAHLDADAHCISHIHSDIITDSHTLSNNDTLTDANSHPNAFAHGDADPNRNSAPSSGRRRLAASRLATDQPGAGAVWSETAGLQ